MKKIINPWKEIKGYFCFGCSPDNEAGLKMEFYEDGNEVISIWHPKPQYQGWLNTLHGGIQAVLLDEICAWVIVRKLQTTGVTSKMETHYLKPVKTTDDFITLKASIREQKRNLVTVDACIIDKEGNVCTRATCVYYTFSREKAKTEMFFCGCNVEEKDVMLAEEQKG